MSDAVRAAVRKTFPGLVVTLLVLLAGQVFDLHWSIGYGAGLVAFTLWMVWFVVTFVRWFEWGESE
ncbi:hypothetical protein [Haloarchaeobius sp. TZWSO28]|uniref:hypothetical protein n=1 Tax=Haloarchaeobius sp. TZWSO28 TaxID=3446119 RepID=UPI003EBF6E5C